MEMTSKKELEPIPTIKERGSNIYRPSDIKRCGVERFLEATAVRDPLLLEFPEFTDEESRRMDEVLEEEKNRK